MGNTGMQDLPVILDFAEVHNQSPPVKKPHEHGFGMCSILVGFRAIFLPACYHVAPASSALRSLPTTGGRRPLIVARKSITRSLCLRAAANISSVLDADRRRAGTAFAKAETTAYQSVLRFNSLAAMDCWRWKGILQLSPLQ